MFAATTNMFGKAMLPEAARITSRPRPCAPAALPGATVTGDDVARLAGAGHRFLATDIAPEQPVLTGHLTAQALRPGLRVHCAEVNDLHDMRTHTVAEPGLRVLILLDGCVDVSFGSRRVSVSARPERGGAPRPVGLLIGLTHAEIFERRWQRGSPRHCLERNHAQAVAGEPCARPGRAVRRAGRH